MPVYKLDLNRGNDANDGISAPWQNLSRLDTFTPVTGDVIALASDSWWVIENRVQLPSNTAGTKLNPVLITKYDPFGASNEKPRITLRRTLSAGDFTYDAVNNGWYYDTTPMVSVGSLGWNAFVQLGGQPGLRTETLPLPTRDRSWGSTGRLFYVYAPAGQNPVNYYGSVDLGHSTGALSMSDYCSHVVVEKLKAVDGAGLMFAYTYVGERNITVRDIESDNSACPIRFLPDNTSVVNIAVHDCDFNEGQNAFVAAYTASNLGVGTLRIFNNRFKAGNLGWPSGQVYVQTRLGSTQIYGNEFIGARYGTANMENDGCSVYTEVGSDRVVVTGNTVRESYLAFTDNSGRGVIWQGNVVANCHAAIIVNDNSNIGTMNHTFVNNTCVNLGVPIAPQGPSAMGGIGWYMFDQPSTGERFRISNNIFHRFAGSARSDPAIETPVSTTGPAEISYNCVSGFATPVAAYTGAASSPVATNTITADPLLDASYRPMAGSPCIGAGTGVSGVRLVDFYGKEIDRVPDIGAMQVYAARTAAAARTQATARTASSQRSTLLNGRAIPG